MSTPSNASFFIGDSALAAQMRHHPWSDTALGNPETWPSALKTLVSVMLGARQAMLTAWGGDGLMLYNDAYAEIIGSKHPHSLGKPVREVFQEAWHTLAPLFERVAQGDPVQIDDFPLAIERNGVMREAFFTFSYTPVRDEHDRVAGLFCATRETTTEVHSQKALTQERERQQLLLQQMPGFVSLLQGPNHVFTYANDAYEEITGHRELIGRAVREVFPELEGQGYFELLDQVFRTGTAFSARDLPVHLIDDVDERFIDLLYAPIRGDDGEVTGIFVGGYDVTTAHRDADALRASEGRLLALNVDLEQQVLERARERGFTWHVSADLLSVVNAQGRFESANPAWTSMLGWSIDDLARTPLLDLVHPDDRDASVAMFRTLLAGRPVVRFENRLRTTSGDYRWLQWVSTPEGGRFYSSARDVTAEKQADFALEEAQARLRAVFETSYQLQGLVATDGTLLDINATALAIVGRTADEVVGRPLWETPWFAPTPGVPELVREAVAVAAAGGQSRQDIHIHTPKGPRWLDFSIRPIRDRHGEVIAVVPEGIDTTERKLAEDALRQAQKLEAMGQLTGGMAHDFNNLLTPIIGSLDLLRLRGSEDDQRRIARALVSADRAKTLVQRLLAFARQQPLQTTAVDVRALIQGMSELIVSSAWPNIRIVIDVAPELPPAQADANQLEMALLNLSVNARDAMQDGGTLTIAARSVKVGKGHRSGLRAGVYVCLSVSDTGEGMDDITRGRAVEPFFSTKGLGKGTGLGLSMVHGLALQLNGALAIDSTPGVGTRVDLWFPASTGAVAATAQPAENDSREPSLGTVLLVDDEDAVREITGDILQLLGYQVASAASAAEALAMLDDGLAVDLLITDHLMPGMTGGQLAAVFRQRQPDTPVLVISGYADADDLPPSLPRLAKPFRMNELAARLASLRHGSGPATPSVYP